MQRVVAETEEGGSDTQSETVEACRESVESYRVLIRQSVKVVRVLNI